MSFITDERENNTNKMRTDEAKISLDGRTKTVQKTTDGALPQAVFSVLKRCVASGDKVAIAVSGGADSMCLLDIVAKVFPHDRIVVLNVEHGIRGEESVRDSEFVRHTAERYGIEFIGRKADVPSLCKASGRSEETEARLYRKEFFGEILSSGKADKILTAHNAGDRTEGILMHIFRGAGIRGLIGMTEADGDFVHPLISVPRAEIERYNHDNGIEYVTDSTNADTKYTRNFIRKQVIPLISERYNLTGAIETLSENARTDDEFIRSMLDFDGNITTDGEAVYLNESALKTPFALSSRYIAEAARRAGYVVDFGRKQVESVLSLLSLENGARVDLVGGLVASKEYGVIAFYTIDGDDGAEAEEIPFSVGFTPYLDGIIEVTSVLPMPERGKLVIDGDKVPDGAVVRVRREGDEFCPYGGKNKKLKEYLIDKKIPLRKRDKLPLLCYNDKVLAIFGIEIADEVKITDGTINALELKYSV